MNTRSSNVEADYPSDDCSTGKIRTWVHQKPLKFFKQVLPSIEVLHLCKK